MTEIESCCEIYRLDEPTQKFIHFKKLDIDSYYLTVFPHINFQTSIILIMDNNTNLNLFDLNQSNSTTPIRKNDDIYFFGKYYPYYSYDTKGNETIQLIECAETYVKILNIDIQLNLKEIMSFKVETKDSINKAIIMNLKDKKFLYCNTDSNKLYVYEYNTKLFIKKIEKCKDIICINSTKILSYDEDKIKIIDVNTNAIDEIEPRKIKLINLQLIHSSMPYISSQSTRKDKLHILEIK